MSRASEFSARTKAQAFERANGQCEDCTARLFPGNIEYDHIVPVALGGESTLANCACRCRACHRVKTSTQDVPRIAKAKRTARKHIGATARKSRPLDGSKDSKWKMTFNGPVLR